MTSLREHALGFLARREHSKLELSQKLARHQEDQAEIDQLLSILVREGLQSDCRFAESYVRSRMQAGYGPLRIERELQQRGVSAEIIGSCMEIDSQLWQEVLTNAWDKKYRGVYPSDAKSYARQFRFLSQRGFALDMIKNLDLRKF